ncbi:alanine/glycine:cation symporter family protein [Spirulina major CS-329]|uniref:alanine/glycine:cation symporter family protein n=1 Tax=Spirulina TaxID=1154 RepID=UPI00232C6282|nr:MULTISPECIES: alanine/glycine:cation symporter family protein [Spirulina]MDB9493010.1 alanine/glycine:cation symporter family protein [Spirulina subsalsa CS-330]MDB9503373.1 alanine/glycine:cation symporter family protein [Spirulina major CS-329]
MKLFRPRRPLHPWVTAVRNLGLMLIQNPLWRSIGFTAFLICAIAPRAFAQDAAVTGADAIFKPIVDVMSVLLFFKIGGENGFPFIVLWLFIAAIFFTVRMGFINVRGFKHAIEVVQGKFDDPNDEGEVSHFQALATAVSGTVGLGNIAGVAVAIQLGGPGAMVWLTLAGFCGMVTKFVECTLAVKYRRIATDGTVLGGPMYYLTRGLSPKGMRPLGKGLAVLFCILCLGGSLGGANMFQSNQAYAAISGLLPGIPAWLFGLVLAALAGFVIIGGIRRIGAVAEKLVPAMAVIYAVACLFVIVANITAVPAAVATIFREAFAPSAAVGGIVGVMVQGIRRSSFSNEAGVGSAAIAHSAARTDEHIREGIVALLEPFIDTVVICNMTAIAIVLSGVYQDTGDELSGVAMTSNAFASVISWFPIVLSIAVCLFAFSTIISWSYYGIQAWSYLFGSETTIIFKVIYIVCTFLGCLTSLGLIIEFSDLMLLGMAFPNLIGCYILSNEVASDLKDYWDRLSSGNMLTYE